MMYCANCGEELNEIEEMIMKHIIEEEKLDEDEVEPICSKCVFYDELVDRSLH